MCHDRVPVEHPREIRRVGGQRTELADVRIVAATNIPPARLSDPADGRSTYVLREATNARPGGPTAAVRLAS